MQIESDKSKSTPFSSIVGFRLLIQDQRQSLLLPAMLNISDVSMSTVVYPEIIPYLSDKTEVDEQKVDISKLVTFNQLPPPLPIPVIRIPALPKKQQERRTRLDLNYPVDPFNLRKLEAGVINTAPFKIRDEERMNYLSSFLSNIEFNHPVFTYIHHKIVNELFYPEISKLTSNLQRFYGLSLSSTPTSDWIQLIQNLEVSSDGEMTLHLQRMTTIFNLLYVWERKIREPGIKAENSRSQYPDFTLGRSIGDIQLRPIDTTVQNRLNLVFRFQDLYQGIQNIVTNLAEMVKIDNGQLWYDYLDIQVKIIEEMRSLYDVELDPTNRVYYHVLSIHRYRLSLKPIIQGIGSILNDNQFIQRYQDSYTNINLLPIELYPVETLSLLNEFIFDIHNDLYSYIVPSLKGVYWGIAQYHAFSAFNFQYDAEPFEYQKFIFNPLSEKRLLDGKAISQPLSFVNRHPRLMELWVKEAQRLLNEQSGLLALPAPSIEQFSKAVISLDSKNLIGMVSYMFQDTLPPNIHDIMEQCSVELIDKHQYIQDCGIRAINEVARYTNIQTSEGIEILDKRDIEDYQQDIVSGFYQWKLLGVNLGKEASDVWYSVIRSSSLMVHAYVGLITVVCLSAIPWAPKSTSFLLTIGFGLPILDLIFITQILQDIVIVSAQLILYYGGPPAAVYGAYKAAVYVARNLETKKDEVEIRLSRHTFIPTTLRNNLIKSILDTIQSFISLIEPKSRVETTSEVTLIRFLPLLLNL